MVTESQMLSKIRVSTYIRQNIPHNRHQTLPTWKRRKTTCGIDYCHVYQSSDISMHQPALSMYSALDAEEFPRRDGFATHNRRRIHEGYDEILQPIDNDRS